MISADDGTTSYPERSKVMRQFEAFLVQLCKKLHFYNSLIGGGQVVDSYFSN